HGVALADALLVDLQAVAVALGVAELQWVAGADARGEFLVRAVVEEHLEALARGEPEVVAALGADVEVLLDFLAVDDLLAVVALDPKPLGDGDLLLLDRLPRLFLFSEPGHRGRTLLT